MGKHKGHRYSVTVDDGLYKDLQHVRAVYGFDSLCQYTIAAVKIVTAHLQAMEQRRVPMDDADTEIAEMFNEFTNWENTPDGTVPVRHNTKQEYYG